MRCFSYHRWIGTGIAILVLSGIAPRAVDAKPRKVYLNIPFLMHQDAARVEKITGPPIRNYSDDVGHMYRDYSMPFGIVKVSYYDKLTSTFNITLKSPERSATTVAARFGINIAHRKPDSQANGFQMWTAHFSNPTIMNVSVEASKGRTWNSICISDWTSQNE